MQSTPATHKLTWTAKIVSYVLYAWMLVTMVILLLGFILLLFGANPDAGFTQWAYRNLERVMEPFRGIFEPVVIGSNAGDVPAIVDTSILFAMVVYGIVLLAVRAFIEWLNQRLARIDAEQLVEIQN